MVAQVHEYTKNHQIALVKCEFKDPPIISQ